MTAPACVVIDGVTWATMVADVARLILVLIALIWLASIRLDWWEFIIRRRFRQFRMWLARRRAMSA